MSNDRLDRQLLQTGTYTVVVEDHNHSLTGTYGVSLLNVTAGPLSGGSSVYNTTADRFDYTLLESGQFTIVVQDDNLLDTGEYRLTFQRFDVIVGVEPEQPTPVVTSLRAYPNPFTSTATLSLSVPAGVSTEVHVFDSAGSLVRTWVQGPSAIGSRQILWEGRDEQGSRVACGVCYIQVRAGSETLRRRIVYVR